jgi:hypothetical protein
LRAPNEKNIEQFSKLAKKKMIPNNKTRKNKTKSQIKMNVHQIV